MKVNGPGRSKFGQSLKKLLAVGEACVVIF